MKSKQIFQSRSPQRDAFGTGIRREMTSQLYQAVNELPDIYKDDGLKIQNLKTLVVLFSYPKRLTIENKPG